jgi:hypothetical protein
MQYLFSVRRHSSHFVLESYGKRSVRQFISCSDFHICRIDIGDSPYAANLQIDDQGRVLMWLWLRDPLPPVLPKPMTCGCLAVPRVLNYVTKPNHDGGGLVSVLFQEPIPELGKLRGAQLWSASAGSPVATTSSLHIYDAVGDHYDCEVVINRCTIPYYKQECDDTALTIQLQACKDGVPDEPHILLMYYILSRQPCLSEKGFKNSRTLSSWNCVKSLHDMQLEVFRCFPQRCTSTA